MKTAFATSVVPTLVAVPAVTPPANGMVSMTPEQFEAAMKAAVTAAMASFQAPAAAPVAPAKAPKTRKAPVTTTVNVTPVTAAPVASGPIDFALAGKTAVCYKAAKSAVKAAGLTWNGVKGEGSKGGKYENPKLYWATYWAGFNTKAAELGVPTHEAKAE